MNNNKFESNKKYFTISIYAICVVFICICIINAVLNWENVYKNVMNGVSVVMPFLTGAFIAYMINPLTRRIDGDLLNKRFHMKSEKARKIVSILISYIVVFTFIGVSLFIVLPQIVKSLTDLIQIIPTFYNQIFDFIVTFEEKYPNIDFVYLNELLEDFIPDLTGYLKNLVTNVLPVLYTTSVSVIRFIFNVIISLIVSCYMLSDKRILLRNFKRLMYAVMSEKKADFMVETLRECDKIFGGFIIGKFIDSIIIGLLCFISMSILQLPYALLISAIVGITNMIPYFGPFIGCVPGFLLLVLISPLKSIIFLILILVLQQFDGLVLGPKILGDSTGLKPLWIIFAITVGGSLAGVPGMFFGVPVTAVIAYLVERVIQERLRQKNINI